MKSKRLGWFLIFFTVGLPVFLPSSTFSKQIPNPIETFIRTGLYVLFLLGAVVFALKKKFWPISFSFFLAVFSQFLAW